MAKPAVPLNALKAFEATARHLSFTRAALELHVTQAAISHQVKGLEDRLKVKLLRRSSRGLQLTDEGLALAPPALFARELQSGQLAQPFAMAVDVGGYWLTRLKSRPSTPGMQAFRSWLLEAFQGQA